jgi:hypothetical protein
VYTPTIERGLLSRLDDSVSRSRTGPRRTCAAKEDNAGRRGDSHVLVLDEHGRGTYGPPENREFYPTEAFAAIHPAH